MSDPVTRVVPNKPLTATEYAVAVLIGINRSYDQIAADLEIKKSTVHSHATNASRKLPGDLPNKAKLLAWSRGATLDVLEGRSLRYEVMLRARDGA